MNDASPLEMKMAAAAIVCGCATLLFRPALMPRVGGTAFVVVLFAALLAIGLSGPVLDGVDHATRVVPPGTAILVGCAALLLGRVLVSGDAVAAALPRIVLLNTLAAIAEEAFFRRLLYGMLSRRGAAVAVFGSAALFAVVHVTVYGWWVLPIDLAAGLLFSWQRWATGSWAAPAVTHVMANLLAVL
jgi:membrane protease YdiL (CAAX protease family)